MIGEEHTEHLSNYFSSAFSYFQYLTTTFHVIYSRKCIANATAFFRWPRIQTFYFTYGTNNKKTIYNFRLVSLTKFWFKINIYVFTYVVRVQSIPAAFF